MIQSISRRWWLGLVAMAWLSAIGVGQAWERPRVNTEFKFKFEVTVGPEQIRPSAPWYMFFPADPRMMPSQQVTPYPSWPGQFPPAAQPFDKGVQKQSFAPRVPSGPMLTQYQNIPYGYSTNVLPVSYTPAQVPSYWYQGR
jgi:hypothetical protein